MRVADLLVSRLYEWGLDVCFAVTGGGAMHLNDAFASNSAFRVIYMHHEQACSMAAEGYARVAEKPAVVNVTTGPGVINALNGVFGAFTDSIPMVVISGQVRVSTMAATYGKTALRQLGDQEVRTDQVVQSMVKAYWLVEDPSDIINVLDAAVRESMAGRPGPVWIDIPVDVQGILIDDLGSAPLPRGGLPGSSGITQEASSVAMEIVSILAQAKRPLILAGTGVRLSGTTNELLELAERAGIPVATAWTHDIFPNDHPLYAGRPGTIGTRPGNFILQACDVLLVLGSRLNIRQTSYNFADFAPHARVVWVDVDPEELSKPFVHPDVPVVADLRAFMPALVNAVTSSDVRPQLDWIRWCDSVRSNYEPRSVDYVASDAGINPYHLIMAVDDFLPPDSIVVCGNATACIVPFQVLKVKLGGRLFSNSGSASMGYDLPAAIGASVAAPHQTVVCVAGDGSLMMNLQELQTLRSLDSNVLLLVLDNGGYLSIRQTQSNFFGKEAGCSPESDLHFPDLAEVCRAFGLPTIELVEGSDWPDQVLRALLDSGSRVAVAYLDPKQEFEPRIKSRMSGGTIVTPALDDMYPHFDDSLLADIRSQGLATG